MDTKECDSTDDCGDPFKICHQSKCICTRERPVEDTINKLCLELSDIGGNCSVEGQCLGNSICLQGVCSCGAGVKIYNPSTKIDYCHEKVKLFEECNNDLQCPKNAYCSQDKLGCLCANGFAESNQLCIPKMCQNSTDCESEFHKCVDDLCMCQPGHFDVTSAKCFKFGSRTGGNLQFDDSDDNNFIQNFINDLTNSDSDNLWILIIIVIICVLITATVIILLCKKHYLRYRFISCKKEYEPNVPAAEKGFRSNDFNDKSFRRLKDGENA